MTEKLGGGRRMNISRIRSCVAVMMMFMMMVYEISAHVRDTGACAPAGAHVHGENLFAHLRGDLVRLKHPLCDLELL